MTDQPPYEKIITQIASIFIENKLNIDMIYYFLTHYACIHAQAMGKTIDQIMSDIETIFKSLPQPIEEIDDNPDEQPNCKGT